MSSNKIQIIISGNLTGFTHFYATQGVKDWYEESEINFDYRNLVTFLEQNGEKAYALSFASRVVAVSLVTRILDTSRRPGVLVVSVLLPRGKKVAAVTPSGSNTALYDLLNALNSRFCERNLIGEELNPSLSVLRQDYYSDILSGYQLVSDAGQRKLNMDVASLKKGVGYVAAEERVMSAYLASLFRLSYEGYPHVFFAPNAPANIDEPAEEEIMYQVRVTNKATNTGRMLPGWGRSKDKIYQLAPEYWQLPIENLDYSYEDVLQGKAGRQIRASVGIDGILDVTYDFAPQTKEIAFVFKKKGGKALDFAEVAPVWIKDKQREMSYPLPSDTYEFRGEEIYGKKSLESDRYFIEPEFLDFSQCGSKCVMTVERKTILQFDFPAPFDAVSKRITVTRVGTNQSIQRENIKGKYSCPVPGNQEEWEYRIEAEGYKMQHGQYPPEGEKIRLNLVEMRKPEEVSQSPSGQRQGTGSTMRAELQDTRQSASTELSRANNNTEGNAVPIIHVTNGGQNGKKRKGNAWGGKLLPFLIALPVLALAVGLSIFLYRNNGETPSSDDNEVLGDTALVTKMVIVKYKDFSKNKLPDDFNTNVAPILHCYWKSSTQYIKLEKSHMDGSQVELTASEDCKDTVEIIASFDSITLGEPLKMAFDSFKNDTTVVTYPLNVNTSDLDLYREMYNLNALGERMGDDLLKKYNKLEDAWNQDNGNSLFVEKIKDLYEKVKPEARGEKVEKMVLNKLSDVDISLEEISEFKKHFENAGTYNSATFSEDGQSVLVKNRIEALKGAINTLKYGYPPEDPNRSFRPSTTNLSRVQNEAIETVFGNEKTTKSVNNFLSSKSRRKEIADMQSLQSILEYITDNLKR